MNDLNWIHQSNLIEGVDESAEDARSEEAWKWFICMPLSMVTILGVHRRLMSVKLGKQAGKFRTHDVRVGSRVCPPSVHVPSLMWNWFFVFEKADTEQAIKEAHIAFEKVRPFIDGNGRSGRMIMNYQRVKAGFEPLCIEAAKRWDYYKWFEETPIPIDKQMKLAFENQDTYTVEENDEVWELYRGRTDFTHGFKIIQAHKKVSMPLGSLNLVPLTEYTPSLLESAEITNALNEYPKLLAWKKNVLQAMESYAIAKDTQTDKEAHLSYIDLVKATGIDKVLG